jgi:hypothetical protein
MFVLATPPLVVGGVVGSLESNPCASLISKADLAI